MKLRSIINESGKAMMCAAGLLLVAPAAGAAGKAVAQKADGEPVVLVYTRNHVTNGKGYVHENIPASIEMIKRLGERAHFKVEVSDDPELFTDESLKRFSVLVFANSNNEAFTTQQQREALQRYIRGGGGWVGIHSACASERDWPWFWAMVGGKFVRHSPQQQYDVHVIDGKNPATRHLGKVWKWSKDEFYYVDYINPDIHILLAGDLTKIKDKNIAKYPGKVFGDVFPVAWCHEFEGGREFFTTLGHNASQYSDPAFEQHVLGGILWAMGRDK